jgi:hypothetical protein
MYVRLAAPVTVLVVVFGLSLLCGVVFVILSWNASGRAVRFGSAIRRRGWARAINGSEAWPAAKIF